MKKKKETITDLDILVGRLEQLSNATPGFSHVEADQLLCEALKKYAGETGERIAAAYLAARDRIGFYYGPR